MNNVSIFVDVQNIYYTVKESYKSNFDYNTFWSKATYQRKVVKAIAYAIYSKDDKRKQFHNILRGIGFEVKLKPFIQRSDGSAKGDWDVGITLDIMEYAKEKCKVIIPIRSPIESALSCIGRNGGIGECKKNWDIMLNDIIPKYDIFWLDINTPHHMRHKMMNKLNEFIERVPADKLKLYRYVTEWKPLNSYAKCAPLKKAYASKGQLPQEHNFKILNNATEWYNRKTKELVTQYA